MLWALCWSLSLSSLVALSSSEAVLCGGGEWLLCGVDVGCRSGCGFSGLCPWSVLPVVSGNHCRTLPLSLGVVAWLARAQGGG
jgi:hypothetical protein